MKLFRAMLAACGAAFFASASAFACPSCAVASEKARFAYYFTTGLLSLLPLAMLGAAIFYLVKRSK